MLDRPSLISRSAVAVALLSALACGSPQTEAEGGGPHPDVAKVTCKADGSTLATTPIVQAQRDGVHFDVKVPPNSELAFVVPGHGRNAEDGPFVFDLAPGEIRVACLARDQDIDDDSLYEQVTIVDNEGVYVDAPMNCEASGVGGEHPGQDLGPDPVEGTRGFLTGLRNTDELLRVGYVGRTSEATVAVRRDGEVIAALSMVPIDDGDWGWIGFSSCPDSGISY
jgi:hypothetical protein